MTSEELDELLAEAYEHLRQGRYRMALTASKKVYDQRPNDYNAISCLAWAMLENSNPAQSLELANLAVQISEGDVNSRLYRGFLLMRMSIYEGALSDLDWAISHKPDQLVWAHLNKARTLGGLERYFEGLEEIDKAIEIEDEENPKLNQVRDWFRRILGYDEGFFSGIFSKKSSLLDEGEEALKNKEYWFSIWAAKEILNKPQLSKDHYQARLLELESMLSMFQTKPSLDKAEEMKFEYEQDPRFQNIYQRVLKFSPKDLFIEDDELLLSGEMRSDLEKYDNKLFNVLHAKTFDLLENLRAGKRTYLLQFNEETIRYIGIEVAIDNPFYGNKQMNVDGVVVWHLNKIEAGRHQFNLGLEKDWKTVEFVQSWGTEIPGFWQQGQGRVDIFLDSYLVCSRWFVIGQAEIVNFEETEKNVEEFKQPEKPVTDQPSPVEQISSKSHEQKSLDELLNELNTFIGMQSIKQSMKDFVDYLNFINERKKLGLKTQDNLSMHSVFIGNPGTGKTTVARLLGKIFKAMGLLKNGHVIEVDRSGLVGQYIGETAQKTDKAINEALGGVLFIDEAYTLKKEGAQSDFGQEAIDILIKRMEDKEGEFVVITAGYPDEMNTFINSNPGFKSRFNHTFNFEDFTPEELLEIFKQTAAKEEYAIEDEALKILLKEFKKLYRKRDRSFGNARLVKNIFNHAKIQLSKRYLKLEDNHRTKDALTTIKADDIISAFRNSTVKDMKLGIDEENLEKALNKLNGLTGLNSVKREINELVKLARFYSEQGEDLQNKFSSHLVFLGNPGTGKTTIARLFSEIYSALGILPRGHLVEIDRQGLVGSYVGHTAEKTKEVIDKAIGGTLFIDEAYSLVKKGDNTGSDFGQEAIDTLLKRMEDDRGKFIVIAAGYTNEMQRFLESNPGIQSRFTRAITFEDYSPEELMTITENYLKEKGHNLDKEAKENLKKYFNKIYRNRDKTFGNARLVRNLMEGTLKNHLLRIADIPAGQRNEEIIKIITLDDIEDLIPLKKEQSSIKIEGDAELLDTYIKELSELTGLDSVKKSVEKLVSSLKVAKLREQRGLKVIPKNLHSVFMGNPGTGKTTIARLISKIYKEMGVLEKGHIVEVDRSGLVAGYQGQTAIKTDEVINKAMGGTLFIDEAYSLVRGGTDFGQEALETLLKRMEDYQGKFVVIVAGYTDEMKEFIESNPGLQSRFTNYFLFEDFTPRQMLEIALVISEKNGYKLDEGAWQLLLDLFTKLYNNRDKNFGNARTVRNILYKAISNQEERILKLYNLNDENLTTIILDDVDNIDVTEL